MRCELTADRLRELLHYDPETGVFTRLARMGRRGLVGDIVGGAASDGYLVAKVDGKPYKAHRLAWLYVTGEWPRDMIDHINGVRDDNRWSNLRDVTRAENGQNRRPSTGGRLGLLGVSANGSRFKAEITVDGRNNYLGTFDTPEQAHEAYIAAKRRLHPGNTL